MIWPYRRAILVLGEMKWIIERAKADLTSRSLRADANRRGHPRPHCQNKSGDVSGRNDLGGNSLFRYPLRFDRASSKGKAQNSTSGMMRESGGLQSVLGFLRALGWGIGTVAIVTLVGGVSLPSLAENPSSQEVLRVENRVYRGHDELISQSLTIILTDRAYDFLDAPSEGTIIDFARKRITFLDFQRREQAQVSFETILLFLDRLRARAGEHPDPGFRFAAQPSFEIRQDGPDVWLFSSSWMTYRVRTQQGFDQSTCETFWKVSDWITRANTLLVPGSRPPFARLAVNETLRDKKLLPREVVLVPAARNFLEWLPGRRAELRGVHTISGELAPEDRTRLEKADQAMLSFRRVNLIDYQSSRRGAKEEPH